MNRTVDGLLFWQSVSGIYDAFLRKDAQAYERMYARIRTRLGGKSVLELATGTGLIARNVAGSAKQFIATDFSPGMIERAKRSTDIRNLSFEVCDACSLPFGDANFDVVIISNALHIMPHPEAALSEISRVLRDDGLLIAPTFTHANMGLSARIKSCVMQAFGFPLGHAWTPGSYSAFLEAHGFSTVLLEVIASSFPLTYIECQKKGAGK
jgi:ubiquinone/menaquinone biosynthesis C-methylase UbiE